MPENKYDVIVSGVGSMGSATCYFLAAKGYKVLGLEQFTIPHEAGSHTGQSRIIRKAYFEHKDYVPLLERAYQNWARLEELTKEQVYFKTGLLYFGPPGHLMIKGIKEAAAEYKVQLQQVSPLDNFPQFIIPENTDVILEPDAGFVRPERAISLYKQEAEKSGAVIRTHEEILEWKKNKQDITVVTNKNTYQCKKLVITSGAWTSKIVSQLPTTLKITRQVIAWIKPKNEEAYSIENFPCWMIADNKREGVLYGFPFLKKENFGMPEGLKFAWHHPAEETNPDIVNRHVSPDEVEKLLKDTAEYIPAIAQSELSAVKTCLYTNSADENFIIDHLPGYDGDVTIACGFSGHGFKFVSVVGEILADLAMEGKSDLPIDFLSFARFG